MSAPSALFALATLARRLGVRVSVHVLQDARGTFYHMRAGVVAHEGADLADVAFTVLARLHLALMLQQDFWPYNVSLDH